MSFDVLSCCRHTAKGTFVRKISVIDNGLFHLMDDIFWILGFKKADKVKGK
jgi:hypothetical protein